MGAAPRTSAGPVQGHGSSGMPSWTSWAMLSLAFVLLLQGASCRPSSSSLDDDRSGRSLLRVAAWPWYSSRRLPVSSSSSWNVFSLPVAARLSATPLTVAPVAAPVAAPVWELPRLMTPIAQKQAASDYFMVSLASPTSGGSRPVRYDWQTPAPATTPAAPATPSWLRLVTGGTPLYDLVESVQSDTRPHLLINRAATRRVAPVAATPAPTRPTWAPSYSPSPATLAATPAVAVLPRGDQPEDGANGATGLVAGTTASAHTDEAGSTVYVFTTSAVAATDEAPYDAASGVATLSAWDDQWASNSDRAATSLQPVFETTVATHQPTIVITDIAETTSTAYQTAEATAATSHQAETTVAAETAAPTTDRVDTTASPTEWSETVAPTEVVSAGTSASPERPETTTAKEQAETTAPLLEQAVTTVTAEVTTNTSLSTNPVTEPPAVVTTGFEPESTPSYTATEAVFSSSTPALTTDEAEAATVISVSTPPTQDGHDTNGPLVTTDLLLTETWVPTSEATAAVASEPLVTTELSPDVGSPVTTTQPQDDGAVSTTPRPTIPEEAETERSESSTVPLETTATDLPTTYNLDTIEIEINRRGQLGVFLDGVLSTTAAPATTDFPDGVLSTTAAPTTTEAFSPLAVEAEGSTASWTTEPTDVTYAAQNAESATDAIFSTTSPTSEVFSTSSATTEIVSTTSAPTESVSTASAPPEDVSMYTEPIWTTAEVGPSVWTEAATTLDPAPTDGFSTLSSPTESFLTSEEEYSTMTDAWSTLLSEATTTADAAPTEASTYLVDVLTTSPADVDPTASEMTASAPQATFSWSAGTDTTPQTFTVVTYPLPGTSKSPFVAPLTLRPTSAPVEDFNYYDGVAFEDGVVAGGGSPADSYIPDYDSRSDEYDGDYFSDAAVRQRPPLSPPPTSDTKGLEIASLVRETPPAPAQDSHRRSDVLPEDDVDDVSNEVGSASMAWGSTMGSTPRPAASTPKYGDSFEGQMLRRMVPLVVRQLRLGHLSAEDTERLRYIFGPIWPEVEQMVRAADAGRGRRDAGKYPHFKKWTGDGQPGEGGSSHRGGMVRRPARRPVRRPVRRRPQKHNKGAGHKRGPKRGQKGEGHHAPAPPAPQAEAARLGTQRKPKRAVHKHHHAPKHAVIKHHHAQHAQHAEDHLARPRRALSAPEDAAQAHKEYDDYEEGVEENDEDYLGDDRDYYDADEEDEESDDVAVEEEDEDEDEGLDVDRDSPSVMELHYRGRQAQGLQGADDVQHGRSSSPSKHGDEAMAGALDEDMAMDGAEYEYY